MPDSLTLDDIRRLDRDFLIPAQVAQILHCVPYHINCQVSRDPKALGFPVVKVGSRVKIPRLAFIAFMEGKMQKQKATE